MSWADEEFRGIDLGDTRRNDRAARLLERLAERPTASIPGAEWHLLKRKRLTFCEFLGRGWRGC
jgi:hypothetical protein